MSHCWLQSPSMVDLFDSPMLKRLDSSSSSKDDNSGGGKAQTKVKNKKTEVDKHGFFTCVPCKQKFKTKQGLSGHLKSTKHKSISCFSAT